MRTLPFEAIIFDHDGTVVDTESPEFQAYLMLCQEFGFQPRPDYWATQIVGHINTQARLLDELIQTSRNGLNKATLQKRLRELYQVALTNVELMPGVSRLLPQLQTVGYPLAIATASDRNWVGRWLTHFSLQPYFRVIATRDDVAHSKPAPDVYLVAAQRLNVSPERCLVFEDTVVGAQAAKAAGMTVVAVPSQLTKILNFSLADKVIESLEQVTTDWIAGLNIATR
jgi:HAD superfamily hydrolase (TIGR01509 family)